MASTAAEEAEDAAPDGLNDLSAMSMAQAPAWGPLEYPPARREALKVSFDEAADSGGRLSLRGVHTMLFTQEERAEYAFDNFDEDLQVTTDGKCKDDMSWADVLKFMDDNL